MIYGSLMGSGWLIDNSLMVEWWVEWQLNEFWWSIASLLGGDGWWVVDSSDSVMRLMAINDRLLAVAGLKPLNWWCINDNEMMVNNAWIIYLSIMMDV